MRCTSTTRAIRLAGSAVLAASGLLFAGAAHADFGYTLEKLAFEGDPGPAGGTLSQLTGEVDLDEDGRVTFVSDLNDGVDTRNHVFRVVNGVVSIEVATGDPAPDTGGAVYTDVGRPRSAATDLLAWIGIYDDALFDSHTGAFLRTAAGDVSLLLEGSAAPGGGTIALVFYVHGATPGPRVSLGGFVDTGGPLLAAHFIHEPGGLREVYRDGAAAPAPVGGTFSGVQASDIPALEPDGTLSFHSEVSGGSTASGIFQASPGGTVTPLVLQGDAVTTADGGIFTDFFSLIGTNEAGDISFFAFVDRPSLPADQQAVFVLENGVQREIVIRGEPIPGTSPARYYLQAAGNLPPAIDTAGNTAFVALLTDAAEFVAEPGILVDRNGTLRLLVKEGDPVPGMPGTTFTDFIDVRIHGGQIAFTGYTTSGIGVFLASPPQVDALPPFGSAVLALALTAVAAVYGRRRRA